MDRFLYNPEEPDIHIGAWYEFYRHANGVSYLVRLRALKKFTHHVLFENEAGFRECMTYWTIARTIK